MWEQDPDVLLKQPGYLWSLPEIWIHGIQHAHVERSAAKKCLALAGKMFNWKIIERVHGNKVSVEGD